MVDIGVSEHDVVDVLVVDQVSELVFVVDGYFGWVVRVGKVGWVDLVVDEWDLGGGERYDFYLWVVVVCDVEVVEVVFGGFYDEDLVGYVCESI